MQTWQHNKHRHTSIHKWSDNYANFHSAENNVWSRIFKIIFKTVRDTQIQTFLYNSVHRELFHVIIGYVTLKLKTIKLVTTVVKLMTLHISPKTTSMLMSSAGLTGSVGQNISVS